MQMATEQVLERTGKLAKVEGIYMNEEERIKMKELTVEAR